MKPVYQSPKCSRISHWLQYIRNYIFDCFFRIMCNIKIKFCPALRQFQTNIFNLFLPLLWTMGTSSRPFWKLIKWYYYPICSFSVEIVCCFWSTWKMHSLKRVINYKLVIFDFWLKKVGWWIKKCLDLGPSPANQAISFSKILPVLISICWMILTTKWFFDSQDILKNIHYFKC